VSRRSAALGACRRERAHGSLRSPFTSLATDQSGHAAPSRRLGRRSGRLVSTPALSAFSVAPLAGFRVPGLWAACAIARHHRRRACSATVALDTHPPSGPDARNGLKLAARSRRVAARGSLGADASSALARAQGARGEGASESAETSLSVEVRMPRWYVFTPRSQQPEQPEPVRSSRCRGRPA